MDWLIASFHAHPTGWTLAAYFLFSNAISAMPSPQSTSSGGYRWLFDFSHLMAGNITRIIATRYPNAGINQEGK